MAKKIETKFEKLIEKETKTNKAEILSLTDQIIILTEENEALRNYSMRSIFWGVTEDKHDSWEVIIKCLTYILVKKNLTWIIMS